MGLDQCILDSPTVNTFTLTPGSTVTDSDTHVITLDILDHLDQHHTTTMDTNSLSQSLDSVNTAVSVAGEEEVSCLLSRQ